MTLSAETRADAARRFAELGYPTRHDEEWRFTNVGPIAQTRFAKAGRAMNGWRETLSYYKLKPVSDWWESSPLDSLFYDRLHLDQPGKARLVRPHLPDGELFRPAEMLVDVMIVAGGKSYLHHLYIRDASE